jgi:hypothetical protein
MAGCGGCWAAATGLTTYTRWCIADEIEAGKVVRRVVMVRGVELRSGQDNSIDRMGLWAKLAQCWPEPFETAWNPDSPLVVHRGIAEVAEGVWDDIQAYVKHRPPTAQLTFGGHSLGVRDGGALAIRSSFTSHQYLFETERTPPSTPRCAGPARACIRPTQVRKSQA